MIRTEMGFGPVVVHGRQDSPLLSFAVAKLQEALGRRVISKELRGRPERGSVVVSFEEADALPLGGGVPREKIKPEGFIIVRGGRGGPDFFVIAKDPVGAMYGLLEVAEQARAHGLGGVTEKEVNPKYAFRGVKFNLPWSPYRPGPAAEAQIDTCRDLNFWQKFLDMMAENHFNALTLWNLHPFTYMIRPTNYPKACPFTDAQMAEWRAFWKRLFQMAQQRGIRTYIINWNIVVSEAFTKAYGGKTLGDHSEKVAQYSRECVTQMIDEYPELTGFGTSVGDWMGDSDAKEQEEWIARTMIAGVKNASRKAEFIHRARFDAATKIVRSTLDEAALDQPTFVEVKFNWSHGHSTSKLVLTHNEPSLTSAKNNTLDEGLWKPEPTNYKVLWTVRNEDFFVLRWGEPGFVKAHIAENSRRCVGGYLVGSEGFIPGKDLSHRRPYGDIKHQNWQYAFEKQWLLWMAWGRLLYEPKLPESIFEIAIERRVGSGIGRKMLEAYRRASRMPLRLASFYRATWDFTLYAEMFMAPHKVGFLTVEELLKCKTLDPKFLSIGEYVAMEAQGKSVAKGHVTPLNLAEELEDDGKAVKILVKGLRWRVTEDNGLLGCELDDLETWAELSLYFAAKLRGAVALQRSRLARIKEEQAQAVAYLEEAAKHWEQVVALTSGHYQPIPYANGETYSWDQFTPDVHDDITVARKG